MEKRSFSYRRYDTTPVLYVRVKHQERCATWAQPRQKPRPKPGFDDRACKAHLGLVALPSLSPS
eukprot:9048795-Alexandrium_andersonii.AAC.1